MTLPSLLARCSVVALPHEEAEAEAPTEGGASAGTAVPSLDRDLAVLYDKYVVPKGKITDYRTQWSGITKETYCRGANASSPLPIVSFQQCQNEVARLFSSLDGKRVVVVGHALENDFDALEIEVSRCASPRRKKDFRRLFSCRAACRGNAPRRRDISSPDLAPLPARRDASTPPPSRATRPSTPRTCGGSSAGCSRGSCPP